jgi:hypothetical protein
MPLPGTAPTRWRGGSAAEASASACAVGSSGIDTVNALPSPGTLSTPILPPINSHSRAQIDRPSPVPPMRLDVLDSACTNGLKIRATSDESMPIPESITRHVRTGRSCTSDSTCAVNVILPLDVNLNDIRQQVVDDLHDPRAVAAHRPVKRRRQMRVEAQRPARRKRRIRQREVLQVFDRPERLGHQLHLAGADLRKIEDVVDDVPQSVRRRADRAQPLLVSIEAGRHRQQFEIAEQRVQRRADFVAHRGEKAVLCVHHGFRLALRRANLLVERMAHGDVEQRAEQHVFAAVARRAIADLQVLRVGEVRGGGFDG